jgi:hypothetical protein
LVNLKGGVLQLAYRLRHHFWLGMSLARWLGLLLFVDCVALLIHWWPSLWPASPLALLLLIYISFLIWADRRQYVGFEPAGDGQTLISNASPDPPLHCEERIPIRASGWFEVHGKRQYFVDIEADFETVETQEHIVLGRVHASRFLWLGWWPADELGWWYIFFQPAMIQEVSVGHLGFGTRPQQALRVVYSPGEEVQETIYLAFEDAEAMHCVWHDLLKDAQLAGADRFALGPPNESPISQATD